MSSATRSLPRLVLAVGFVAASAALAANGADFRAFEGWLAARLSFLGLRTFSASDTATVWFGLGEPGAFGLRVTGECSAAYLVAATTTLGALLVPLRRMRPQRVLVAVGAAAALLVLGNQLRIGVIAWLVGSYGVKTGYEWGHLIVGPIVTLVLVSTALLLLVGIVVGRFRPVQVELP